MLKLRLTRFEKYCMEKLGVYSSCKASKLIWRINLLVHMTVTPVGLLIL